MLANRGFAAAHLDFSAAGKLSLATDMTIRLILVAGAALDILLFQIAVHRRATAGAEAGAAHALRFEPGPSEGMKPYVHIRGDLWALATRAVYYELVELGETRDVEGRAMFGVASGKQFFVMCPADAIEGLS